MPERVEQVQRKCPGQLMPSLRHLTYRYCSVAVGARRNTVYTVDDTRNDSFTEDPCNTPSRSASRAARC